MENSDGKKEKKKKKRNAIIFFAVSFVTSETETRPREVFGKCVNHPV